MSTAGNKRVLLKLSIFDMGYDFQILFTKFESHQSIKIKILSALKMNEPFICDAIHLCCIDTKCIFRRILILCCPVIQYMNRSYESQMCYHVFTALVTHGVCMPVFINTRHTITQHTTNLWIDFVGNINLILIQTICE